MLLKPHVTGIGADIFVDDGFSYQRHGHELLLLARNGYGRECDSFIPFSITDNPCVLDENMELKIPQDTIIQVQDFIQSNINLLVALANGQISQELFVQSINNLHKKQ